MISFVFAMDENRLIGKQNELPWHLPADLKFFKQITMGKPIVMGRKTFDSIGKPLPGRENIVLTRDQGFQKEGVTVIHSIEEVLKRNDHEICVIGGSEIFLLFMPFVKRMYITKIHHAFEGDTYFPEIDEQEWKEVSREKGTIDEINKYAHDFVTYEKKTNI